MNALNCFQPLIHQQMYLNIQNLLINNVSKDITKCNGIYLYTNEYHEITFQIEYDVSIQINMRLIMYNGFAIQFHLIYFSMNIRFVFSIYSLCVCHTFPLLSQFCIRIKTLVPKLGFVETYVCCCKYNL